jgi:hypothetical protein
VSRRSPRGPIPPKPSPRRTGKYGDSHGGRWSSPWVIRIVVIVAAAVLAVAIAVAAAQGILFGLPSR